MGHSRQIRGSRAFMVMAWGCLLPYIMVKTTSEATSMRGSIATQELCPKRASSEVLPKTVISSNMRMSVLVGLEGAGHHYLMQSVTDMFNSNVEISESSTLCIKTTPYFTQATMGRSPVAYMDACQYARNEMSKLALQENTLPRPGHLVRLCQEQSYPSGHGASKALHYIDLPMLAATAEEKGVDLRVVYLKRSAHDILVANTIHRRFQKFLGDDTVNPDPNEQFSKYALILLTDAAVMHSFLSEIDPAFVVCHDYAHAGEEEQATRIANFVAPNSAIAGMYNTSLLRTWAKRPSRSEELSFVGSEAVATWLQSELDAFEFSYCG